MPPPKSRFPTPTKNQGILIIVIIVGAIVTLQLTGVIQLQRLFGIEAAITPEEEGPLDKIVFLAIDLSTGETPDEDEVDFECTVHVYTVDVSGMDSDQMADLEFGDYTYDSSESDDIEDFELKPENDTFYLFVLNASAEWSSAVYHFDSGEVLAFVDLPMASIDTENYVGFVNETTDFGVLFVTDEKFNTTVSGTTERDWTCMWQTNESDQGLMTQYDLVLDQWSYLAVNFTFNTTAQSSWVNVLSADVAEKVVDVNSTLVFISGLWIDTGGFSFKLASGLNITFDTVGFALGYGSPDDTAAITWFAEQT